VVILKEHLGSKTFVEGVDLAALAADYRALTGRDFPGAVNPTPQPPQPSPAPVPQPSPADEAFAGVLRPWVAHRHVGANRTVQNAAIEWLKATGQQ